MARNGIRHAQSRIQKNRDQRGGPVHSRLCPRASGGLRRPIVPAMMPFDTRRRGFTLLEVLIAVAIVAVIALLGYRALAALSNAETRLAAEATRWRTLDLFFARLEGDMRQAVPRPARSGVVREAPWLGFLNGSRGGGGGSALAVFA